LKSNHSRKIYWITAAVILVIYFSSGIYTIESGQHALITRFGKVVRVSTQPGINYHLPSPFEKVTKVHISQVQKVLIEEPQGQGLECISGDENLILVKAVVSFDVKDVISYLYKIGNPKATIESAARMCINEEIAKRTVDDIMTTGKSVLRFVLKGKIQEELDKLHAGIRIISLELTDISPPPSVSYAFKAVSDARERKQRIIKDAEGYANTVVPKARGEASSTINQAEAYKQETQNLAQARVKAFNVLYTEYRNKPSITSRLRYLETLKSIYKNCQVVVDSDPSQSIYYISKEGKLKTQSSTSQQTNTSKGK
jgi:membrane protease subunit HflK